MKHASVRCAPAGSYFCSSEHSSGYPPTTSSWLHSPMSGNKCAEVGPLSIPVVEAGLGYSSACLTNTIAFILAFLN